MPALFRSVLFPILLLSLNFSVVAQETEATPSEEQLAALKAEADKFGSLRDEQVKTIEALQQQLLTEQRMLVEVKRPLKEAEEAVKKEEETLKPLKEAVAKAEPEKKAAEDAIAAAQKAADDAKGTDQEKETADALAKAQEDAKPKLKAFEDAQAALTSAEQNIAQAKSTVETQPAEIKKQEEKIASIQTEIDKAAQQRDELNTQAVSFLKKYQAGMIAHGKLISFAEKVAPIFAERCLACHNARTAKGRYNMESFSGIVKGGESGAALEIGDADASTLFAMVEDGSMPQDADPLTAEQLADIKKWINTGAVLDAGLSPAAQLIEIMPKFPQPPAPEQYRVTFAVTALAFSPDGKILASSGYHEVLLWNVDNGELVRRIGNVAERTYDIEFSPDGQRIAVAAGTPGQIGEAKIFNVADGTLLADLVRTADSVFAIAFSPDGTRLAIGCADRSIRVYDSVSYEQQVLIEDHADWVTDIAWSNDGTKLASASRDKTSKVFDAVKGDSLVTFNSHGNTVSGVTFTPDNNQVVTAGADKQIRIWNVSDAKQVRNIGGFGDEVFRLVATAEGDVFSVSADKNARRHKIADGAAVKTYSGHADWIYSLARHADSKRIATGSYDGEIRIWNEDDAAIAQQWSAAPGLQQAAATK
ncbi:MAG TPA: c-type cytochrome domain-containing protein [Planctomycetaceae bacterium]|nr:c-type cytochrome domain-containing protein [Planctomycetaceae bacterium]